MRTAGCSPTEDGAVLSPFSAYAIEDINANNMNDTRYLYLILCILQPSLRLYGDMFSEVIRIDGKVCDPVCTYFSFSNAERGRSCQTPNPIHFDGCNRIQKYFVRQLPSISSPFLVGAVQRRSPEVRCRQLLAAGCASPFIGSFQALHQSGKTFPAWSDKQRISWRKH